MRAKFVCITDVNVHGYKFSITIGKIYDGVLWESSKDGKYVKIIDDDNKEGGYDRKWFTTLSEYREKKLEELGI